MRTFLGKYLSIIAIVSLLLAGMPVSEAHAVGATIVVTTDKDDPDGINHLLDHVCTLREAVSNADYNTDDSAGECAVGSAYEPDTITFAGNYTISLPKGELPIIGSIIINGNGAANTTIQASGTPSGTDGAATWRVFDVTSGGNLTLNNLTVRYGQCDGLCRPDAFASGGGGILNDYGTLTIADSVISNNWASGGGGILNYGGTLTITHSAISNNYALEGGGIYSDNDGSLTVTDSTLSGNTGATSGGGIMSFGTSTTATITNSTFSGNWAGDYGGGIYIDSLGAQAITNSTFSGNSADYGGAGIYHPGGQFKLSNTIIANSTGADCSGTVGTEHDNLLEDTGADACGLTNGMNGDVIGSDPNLGPLGNNGGSTQTMALLPGSPAIDAGDDTTCTNAPVGALDQRGITRPNGPHCDFGAYEYQHVFADVPVAGKEWMEWWIDALYNAGITTGCGTNPLIYCPENSTTRAAMAVFMLRAIHGVNYTPPAASGIFADVPVAGKEWMEPWIEEFYNEGITTGCGTNPLIFCPEAAVTRAAMAVLVLRATHGSGYTPPASTGIFADVPVTGKEWMQPWIEEFYNEGITTGCGTNPLIYCPETATTRAAMAVFIDRAFGLYP